MNTVTEEAPPDTIEYCGLRWIRIEGIEGRNCPEYASHDASGTYLRISQYQKGSGYEGQWHWSADFRSLVEKRPAALKPDAGGIRDTREDAMCACANAFDQWISDMRNMLLLMCPGDQYALGFRDGQEYMKAKIVEVME